MVGDRWRPPHRLDMGGLTLGVLRQTRTGRWCTPGARCLVGRSGTAGLLLKDRSVSAEHASVFWSDPGWAVRDLGSRNGTFVGDTRLAPGQKIDLVVGQTVRFGGSQEWRLVHDGAPTALAVPVVSGKLVWTGAMIADRELLALPDEETPEVTVRRQLDRWMVEDEDSQGRGVDGQIVRADNKVWRLFLPPDEDEVVATTAFNSGPRSCLSDAVLRFGVSADEEHVTLSVQSSNQFHEVKPRTHHYLLLTLARQRVEDVKQGVSDSEAGWLHAEDLQRMLRMDRRTLNTQVFRARRQLSKLDLDGSGDIIERRDPARQLRIGVAKIEVQRIGP
ncbi:MAG: FHA domain-containing protein [Myxococcota bacterium]